MRLFAFDTRRNVRAIELSKLRRAEGSTSVSSSRIAQGGHGKCSRHGCSEWQPTFSGRPLSIFRIWFAAGFDAPMAMTLRVAPPGRARGRRVAYPLGNASALSQGIQPVSALGSPPARGRSYGTKEKPQPQDSARGAPQARCSPPEQTRLVYAGVPKDRARTELRIWRRRGAGTRTLWSPNGLGCSEKAGLPRGAEAIGRLTSVSGDALVAPIELS